MTTGREVTDRNAGDWAPAASPAMLQRRAQLLAQVRDFFRERRVMEVETPTVLSATVTDPQIPSLEVAVVPHRFLQTSPEYPMKRLLAAGSGDIYQICHAFRAGERSRLHNPEFTMVEWYRTGFNLQQIMEETAALVARLLGSQPPVESITYNDAFLRELDCDALESPVEDLDRLCRKHGLAGQGLSAATREDLLDFLVAAVVGPRLGQGKITCMHHYPVAQAALAQVDKDDPRTALRFEVYAQGLELANGFVELADSSEQRARFQNDREQRALRGLPDVQVDARMLSALEAGLPACAGVALGFDRVVMLAAGAASIDEVMAFPWERA